MTRGEEKQPEKPRDDFERKLLIGMSVALAILVALDVILIMAMLK